MARKAEGDVGWWWTPDKDNACVLWLDAQFPRTLLNTSGDVACDSGEQVSKWIDRIAGREFIEVAASGPRVSDVRIGKRGRRSADFNGTTEYLRCASADWLNTSSGEVWALVKPEATDTGYRIFLSSADESVDTQHVSPLAYRGDTQGQFVYSRRTGATTNNVKIATSPVLQCKADAWYLVNVRSDGSAVAFTLNGRAVTATVVDGSNNGDWWADSAGRDSVIVGAQVKTSAGFFFDGKIAEILVFNEVLSDARRARVNRYFQNKYGPIYAAALLGASYLIEANIPAYLRPLVSASTAGTVAMDAHGASGETAAQVAARWTSDVKNKGYKLLYLQCGGNDLLNGTPGDNVAATTYATMLTIIEEARAEGMHVIVSTTVPFGNAAGWNQYRNSQQTILNNSLRTLAASDHRYTLFDLYDLVVTSANDPSIAAAYDSGDGLHLNAAGWTACAEELNGIISRVSGTIAV